MVVGGVVLYLLSLHDSSQCQLVTFEQIWQEQLVSLMISCQSVSWHVSQVYWTENIYNRLVRCSPRAKYFRPFLANSRWKCSQWKSPGWLLPLNETLTVGFKERNIPTGPQPWERERVKMVVRRLEHSLSPWTLAQVRARAPAPQCPPVSAHN